VPLKTRKKKTMSLADPGDLEIVPRPDSDAYIERL
jgi:hypothetical protein